MSIEYLFTENDHTSIITKYYKHTVIVTFGTSSKTLLLPLKLTFANFTPHFALITPG